MCMLYTRKGDTGTTQLYGMKERLSKADVLPEALGTLDELNSYIGLCKTLVVNTSLSVQVGKKQYVFSSILHEVQENIFTIQAELAGAPKKIRKSKVSILEKITDTIETLVPPIHSFSISGGTPLSAHMDIARTVARRAERRVVHAHELFPTKIGVHTLAYLNRLSSLLFALARFINHTEQVREVSPTYS